MIAINEIGRIAVLLAGLMLSACGGFGFGGGDVSDISVGDTCEADLDQLNPANWNAEELDSLPRSPYGQGSQQPHIDTSHSGMVVGSNSPIASRVGRKVLENCGDAIDAVLATAMTQISMAMGSWVSFAGMSTLLYYDAETGKVTAVNGGWNAPLNPDPTLSYTVPLGRSVLVHGFMDAAGRAQKTWGNLPWESLFAASIWLAEDGVDIDGSMSTLIQAKAPFLLRTPEGRELFLKEDGSLYGQGDRFTNPLLGQTLRGIAKQGARYMYEGEWADKWVELVNREGGDVSQADLDGYQATFGDPVTGQVRDVTYVGPPLPEYGGHQTLDALRRVEAANLRDIGTPFESGTALAGVFHAWYDNVVGSVQGSHSDAVVAMDADGNIAALTHTINAVMWGSTGIFVDGVSISDAGSIQQTSIIKAGPGGRVSSPMTPSLLLDDQGRPILATSSIGTGLLQLNFNRLVDVVEYGHAYAEAVYFPTFHYQGTANEGAYDPSVLAEARAQGARIVELPDAAAEVLRGYTVGIQVDWDSGLITGVNAGGLNGRADGVSD